MEVDMKLQNLLHSMDIMFEKEGVRKIAHGILHLVTWGKKESAHH